MLNVGDKVGILEICNIYDEQENNTIRKYALCLCDCGNETTKRIQYLNTPRLHSCGCKQYDRSHLTGNKSKGFKGVGEIGANYIQRLEASAIIRNHKFKITLQYIWDLFLQQERKCKLTGEILCFSGQKQTEKGFPQTASLDRIDNNLDYIHENVQWLHKDVNLIKAKLSDAELIKLCKNITKYQDYKLTNPKQEVYEEEKKKVWEYKYFDIIFTYTRQDGRKRPQKMFYAQCICGKRFIGIYAYLSHKRPLRGCGCGYAEENETGASNSHWKGCGLVGLGYFNNLKKNAVERNIGFNITIEQLWELFKTQGGKCFYTGEKLVFGSRNGGGTPHTASVDRIDSNKGYVIDNLRWIHKDINFMKKQLSEARFLELCRKIAERN